MATRMQQRRGTAAQWVSTNSGNGPILAAGEIGYESDTNKFKIGDGTNHWINLDYFIDADSTTNPQFGSSIVFEGATANGFETTLSVTDPTADRAIILPDAAGTVVLANSSTGAVTISGDLTVSGTTTTINSTTINATTGLVFEGSTANDYETTISVVDPTADRQIEFPNVSGTVVTTGNLSTALGATATELGYLSGVTSAIQNQINEKAPSTGSTTYAPKATPTFTGTVTTENLTVTGTTSLGSSTSIGDVSSTEIGYVNGVTSGIQGQLDAKSGTGHNHLLAAGATDVTATAAEVNKLAGLATTAVELGRVAGVTSAIQTQLDAKAALAGPTFTGTVTLPNTTSIGDVSSTEIGYVNGVTSAIQTQLDAKAALSGATFTGAVSGTSLTLSGDLTVNGTTTTINSTELSVDDKNIVLGDVATPSDATADGGGITLKGATDKTFNWVDATDSWTSSENINLASGKDLKVNGTAVISSTAGGFIFTDGTQTKAGVPSLTTTFSKTASYNLSTDGLSLRDGIIEINSADATTLTIPANSTTAFPVGTSIDILQTGAGTVTIAGAVGVTLNSTPGQRLRDQWSSATLLKRAENTWVAMGDLKV